MENFRLKVFRTVAEVMSFRKAAEVLHLSQPAVSQQIRTLEQEAGVQLFDRAGGNARGTQIALTEAGRILLQYAQRVAALMAEAEGAIAALNHEISGELKLGASTTIAQYLLPRILGAFLKQYPHVRLSLISGNTEQIAEAAASGRVALGMIEGPAMRRDLKTELMAPDELVLVVNPTHEWAQRKAPIPPAELVTVPLLMRERGSGSRRVVERALKALGTSLKTLEIAMELDSTEAILSAVEAGLGVGFVSRWAVRRSVRLGTLRVVQVADLKIMREFRFAWAAGVELTGPVAAFQPFAKAAAAPHSGS
ncbi:LysR family transcriptional regulator [Edaphobacter sp. HDX4]|uniref:LysR substrate-binding domain-containing protein n=1 Tax=Edaphobacter sp. HDX4 TaxID=2794064 RepID=UPI002FE5A1FB